jgi:DNA-binding LacI/PurR family transcriptional regulator
VGATLQTIADELGISRSTVSNAYSRPDQLSPELRAKVLETAERLGYPGPNPSARSLRRGRVDAIGVVLTANLSIAFSDPYAVAYLRGLAQAAEERETSLLLLPLPQDEDAALRTVRNAAVDAFCLYCVPLWHPALDVIRSRDLPLVANEEPFEIGPDAMYVGIDEREAARRISEHIANLGHQRVAIVVDMVRDGMPTGPVQDPAPEAIRYYVTRERVLGYRDALGHADVLVINTADNARAEGTAAAAFALDRRDRATAILAGSDVLALGVLDALEARGLRPGRDVSVTGFDDIPEAAAVGLTTIRQPSVERGRIAGALLLDPPDDPAQRRRVLPTELVVRSSTGPAPTTKEEQ